MRRRLEICWLWVCSTYVRSSLFAFLVGLMLAAVLLYGTEAPTWYAWLACALLGVPLGLATVSVKDAHERQARLRSAEPCGCTPHRECDMHDLQADDAFKRSQDRSAD